MAKVHRSSRVNAFQAAKANLKPANAVVTPFVESATESTKEIIAEIKEEAVAVATETASVNKTEEVSAETVAAKSIATEESAVSIPTSSDATEKKSAPGTLNLKAAGEYVNNDLKSIRKQFIVRPDHDAWLRKTAKENNISVNQLICLLIEANME